MKPALIYNMLLESQDVIYIVYILDAQMGAKAPILLDVRTSTSDLDGKS